MPDCFENKAIREQVCFYKALTVASEGVWMSWPGGSSGLPCTSALSGVTAAFAPVSPALEAADYGCTPAAALDYLGGIWQQDNGNTAALWKALREEDGLSAQLEAVSRSARAQPFTVEDRQTLAKVLGPGLRISPSRVEKYYTCRFAYFMEYVLKLRPRRRAEISPDVSGSLVHWVLENALSRTGDQFEQLPEEDVHRLAEELTDEDVKENLPETGTRFEYLVARLKKSIAGLLLFLQEEQRQGLFRPAAFEMGIGMQPGDVPPVTLRTPEGRSIQVIGQIDRVDTMEKDGKTYLRVVDYKTGEKNFNLKDVYCGLDCQMLLYLFTLVRQGQRRFHNPAAAAVLYLMADPAPKQVDRAQADESITYRMDGLILEDQEVIRAMDQEATGIFVPFGFKKDGSPSRAGQKLASLEKLGRIQQHIDRLVVQMAQGLYEGKIEALPQCKGVQSPCQWCDFRSVCCHQDGKNELPLNAPDKPFEEEAETQEEEQ